MEWEKTNSSYTNHQTALVSEERIASLFQPDTHGAQLRSLWGKPFLHTGTRSCSPQSLALFVPTTGDRSMFERHVMQA